MNDHGFTIEDYLSPLGENSFFPEREGAVYWGRSNKKSGNSKRKYSCLTNDTAIEVFPYIW